MCVFICMYTYLKLVATWCSISRVVFVWVLELKDFGKKCSYVVYVCQNACLPIQRYCSASESNLASAEWMTLFWSDWLIWKARYTFFPHVQGKARLNQFIFPMNMRKKIFWLRKPWQKNTFHRTRHHRVWALIYMKHLSSYRRYQTMLCTGIKYFMYLYLSLSLSFLGWRHCKPDRSIHWLPKPVE